MTTPELERDEARQTGEGQPVPAREPRQPPQPAAPVRRRQRLAPPPESLAWRAHW